MKSHKIKEIDAYTESLKFDETPYDNKLNS